MKKNFFTTILLVVSGFTMCAQSILNPSDGYFTETILSSYSNLSTFDFHDDNLLACDGSSVYRFDFATEELIDTYHLPDYAGGYGSFLKVASDGETMWLGFTGGPNGDEIFSYHFATETWSEGIGFTSNLDMEMIGENVLVSGLNSSNWADVNGIFLVDVSGDDNHRKIIETGGYSAGLGVDSQGNVYYATSGGDVNRLYRWDSDIVADVIADSTSEMLTVDDAVVLSDLPTGAYDCNVDDGGNVFFDYNDYTSGEKYLAMWNGTEGEGENFDILAMTKDEYVFYTVINSNGNFQNGGRENSLIVGSYGYPLAILYKEADYMSDNYGMTVGLYPNPTNDVVYLETDSHIESVDIYNMMGQKVETMRLDASLSINMSSYTTGVYAISFEVEGRRISKKIVVR